MGSNESAPSHTLLSTSDAEDVLASPHPSTAQIPMDALRAVHRDFLLLSKHQYHEPVHSFHIHLSSPREHFPSKRMYVPVILRVDSKPGAATLPINKFFSEIEAEPNSTTVLRFALVIQDTLWTWTPDFQHRLCAGGVVVQSDADYPDGVDASVLLYEVFARTDLDWDRIRVSVSIDDSFIGQ